MASFVAGGACRSQHVGASTDVNACAMFHAQLSAPGGAGAWASGSGGATASSPDGGPAMLLDIGMPVSADTNVRGELVRPDHVTIQKVFVAGVPATDDGNDFGSFDATIPFGVLAGAAKGSTVAVLDITAVTNCDSAPVRVGTGTINLLLAPKQITYLVLATPGYSMDAGTYVPTSVAYPVEIDVTANPGAAGASVILSTTMGTINGSQSATVLLSGDGVSPATATVFLSPDPAKQGTAYVTAQAPNERDASVNPDASATTVTTGIRMLGPPVLFPMMVTLPAGDSTQIGIIDRGVLLGCNASPAAGLSITLDHYDLTSKIVYVSRVDAGPADGGQPDGALPAIQIQAARDAGSASATITCFDKYYQTGSATVSVPKP